MMKFLASFLICVVVSVVLTSSVRAQDTVVVQTLTYDSVSRTGVYHFPESGTFEKVLMQYRMRCHDAKVSDQTNRNQGCGEWDYNCETYIIDSSRTDSVILKQASPLISSYTLSSFPYTTIPTQSIIRHLQQQVSYTPVPNFSRRTIGVGV